ncbi:hypothetical protein [Novosphingobium album (ex Hu et al. 2023)]|uniref:Class I SAM-dependent methyltransferase n=1 Tax=Novosphingobium album (ex Hu et al. 2023) TaxID=2930093 RepID=A0ABT0B6R7_9SPHN|nr:hypothetical protein [Novosphingobium album (ex Hu et al. 2023)]MCJ2180609.1 hypothetical protein [Novosphingobium album (ex Hu et al. 2023)]
MTPPEDPRPAVRRVVEPFVYFRDHASAIPGLGGKSRSPNPNYCFHSNYFEYLPGVVLFHIRILDAHSTRGELEVRVHGYRPDNPDLGIKLVAGTRLSLVDIGQDVLELTVRISAIPGVHYAVFGHYTEAADLRATAIDIEAEECGGESAEDYGDAQAPEIAFKAVLPEAVASLVADRPSSLSMPGSQACTLAQVQSDELMMGWPQLVAGHDADGDLLTHWRQVYVLQVLERFGFLGVGASGVALGALPDGLENLLHTQDCLMAARTIEEVADPALTLRGSGHFDFLICLDGSAYFDSFGGFSAFVKAAMRRVLSGGIVILVFDFHAHPAVEADAGRCVLARFEIERLALSLIGHGATVAQLGFPSGRGTDVAPAAIVPFGLAVRR